MERDSFLMVLFQGKYLKKNHKKNMQFYYCLNWIFKCQPTIVYFYIIFKKIENIE